ncbi:hypothetical protein D9M68_993130 [compost metagenome]
MLVLTSYEPVKWKLVRESGAPLLAVLVSGYHKSDVSGAGAARVLDLGRSYAYTRESREYNELNRGVLRRAGKSIDLFQGRYEGSSFEVGP